MKKSDVLHYEEWKNKVVHENPMQLETDNEDIALMYFQEYPEMLEDELQIDVLNNIGKEIAEMPDELFAKNCDNVRSLIQSQPQTRSAEEMYCSMSIDGEQMCVEQCSKCKESDNTPNRKTQDDE